MNLNLATMERNLIVEYFAKISIDSAVKMTYIYKQNNIYDREG